MPKRKRSNNGSKPQSIPLGGTTAVQNVDSCLYGENLKLSEKELGDAWSQTANAQRSKESNYPSTIQDEKFIVECKNKKDEKNAIEFFGGMDSLEDYVIFKLSRMFLHELIVQLVTKYQINSTDYLSTIIEKIYKGGNNSYQSIMGYMLEQESKIRSERLEAAKKKQKILFSPLASDEYFKQHDLTEIAPIIEKHKRLIELAKNKIRSSDSRSISKENEESILNFVNLRILHAISDHGVEKEVVIGKVKEKIKTANREFNLSLKKLPKKVNPERKAWVIAGGPASGKGHLSSIIKAEVALGGQDVKSICTVNPDDYKKILFPTADEYKRVPEAEQSNCTHVESSIVAKKILERLKYKFGLKGKGPDVIIDTVKSRSNKILIAGYGGATVKLYTATCPVDLAIYRAYSRFLYGKNDKGRFVSRNVVISGHKEQSRLMPDILKEHNVLVFIYDTTNSTSLIAKIDDYSRTLIVTNICSAMVFFAKGRLNCEATSNDELYEENEKESEKRAADLMEYVKNNITVKLQDESNHYASISRDAGLIVTNYDAFIEAVKRSCNLINLEEKDVNDFVMKFIRGFVCYKDGENSQVPVSVYKSTTSPKLFYFSGAKEGVIHISEDGKRLGFPEEEFWRSYTSGSQFSRHDFLKVRESEGGPALKL